MLKWALPVRGRQGWQPAPGVQDSSAAHHGHPCRTWLDSSLQWRDCFLPVSCFLPIVALIVACITSR